MNVVSFAATDENYSSPISRTDSEHPMTFFYPTTTTGFMRSSVLPLGVRRLPPGTCDVKVTPDNITQRKKIFFLGDSVLEGKQAKAIKIKLSFTAVPHGDSNR